MRLLCYAKRRLLLCALPLIACCLLAAHAAAFTPVPGAAYRIEGKHSGGCLWGNIYNTSNKIEVRQQTYSGSLPATYTFVPAGRGLYQIVEQARGLVLECDPASPNGSPAGTPIAAWLATAVANSPAQQWSLADAGGGYVAVVNSLTKTVLTVDSGGLGANVRFQTAPNAGYDYQKFRIEEVRSAPVQCIAAAQGYATKVPKRIVLCANTDLGTSVAGTLSGVGTSHAVTFDLQENIWGQYYYAYTDTAFASAPGTYTVAVPGFPSKTFVVADTVYRTVPTQRGVSYVTSLVNGFFVRQRIHDGQTNLLNYLAVSGGTLIPQPGVSGDLHGGWYDATSYDMETAQEATALRYLSNAAEDAQNSGDKSRLLEEATVGADLLVRLQNPDGSWPVSIKPVTDTPITNVRKLLLNTDCGAASKCVLGLAAASRVLQANSPVLAAACLAAAQKGWMYVAANRNNAAAYITDSTIYPRGDWTGDADSILAAALELAATSPQSQATAAALFYEGQFSSSGLWVKRAGSYVRQTSGLFAAISLARFLPSTSGQLNLDIRNQLAYYLAVMTANNSPSFGLNIASLASFRGNNERISKVALAYLNIYAALGDTAARTAALNHYNWVFGTNPFGSSFVISAGGLNAVSAFYRARGESIGELLPGPEVFSTTSITLSASAGYAITEGAVSPTTLVPAFQMLMDKLTAHPSSATIPIDKTISLKSFANSAFVCADMNHARPPTLIANRATASYWEWYTVVDEGDGLVALKSHANSLYVSAGPSGTSTLIANAVAVTPSETFQWTDLGGGLVVLKSVVSHNYVTADLSQSPAASLVPNSAIATVAALFQLTVY